MGNSNSGSLDFEYNISASNYSTICKFSDFLLGEFYKVKNKSTEETLLLKVRAVTNPQKYQQITEGSFHRLSLSHRNLAKITGFAGREITNPSKAYKLSIFFEPLPVDLRKTLQNWKPRNLICRVPNDEDKYLSEGHLMNIMIQLIDVLEYLQVNRISHGDIRPEACFVTEEGNVLICDRELLYANEWSFDAKDGEEKNFLLSPCAFEAFVNHEKNVKENKYKGDVFSLGMTLLECATFKRSSKLYEWTTENPRINKELLATRFYEIQSRYSSKFCQVLAEMLKFDEKERPDFIKLKKWFAQANLLSIRDTLPTLAQQNKSQQQWGTKSVDSKIKGYSPSSVKIGPNLGESDNRKLASKSLIKDDAAPESPLSDLNTPTMDPKSSLEVNDDDEEVVEFDTDGSPNKEVHKDHELSHMKLHDTTISSFSEVKQRFQHITLKDHDNFSQPFVRMSTSTRPSYVTPTKQNFPTRYGHVNSVTPSPVNNHLNNTFSHHRGSVNVTYQHRVSIQTSEISHQVSFIGHSRTSVNHQSQFTSPVILSPVMNQSEPMPPHLFSFSETKQQQQQQQQKQSKNFSIPHLRKNSIGSDEVLGDTERWRGNIGDGTTYATLPSIDIQSPNASAPSSGLLSLQGHLRTSMQPSSQSTFDREGSRTSLDGEAGEIGEKIKALDEVGSMNNGSLVRIGIERIKLPERSMVRSSPSTKRTFEVDNSRVMRKLNYYDTEEIFAKAMERSKETIEMIKNRESINNIVNGTLMLNETLTGH